MARNVVADAKEQLQKLQELDGNDVCCDCTTRHPQWCSVSHGVMICLQCSGIHRSLGVHVTQVRSMTLDKFTQKQLDAMHMGGNNTFNSYMRGHGISKPKECGVREKYLTVAAVKYKDEMKAKVEGREWEPREQAYYEKLISSGSSTKGTALSGGGAYAGVSSTSMLNENANKRTEQGFGSSRSNGNNSGSTDAFSFGDANGNKYTGFGNPNMNRRRTEQEQQSGGSSGDDVLSQGWGTLSMFAASAASTTSMMASSVASNLKSTSDNLRTQLSENEQAQQLGENLRTAGSSAWTSVSSLWGRALSQLDTLTAEERANANTEQGGWNSKEEALAQAQQQRGQATTQPRFHEQYEQESQQDVNHMQAEYDRFLDDDDNHSPAGGHDHDTDNGDGWGDEDLFGVPDDGSHGAAEQDDDGWTGFNFATQDEEDASIDDLLASRSSHTSTTSLGTEDPSSLRGTMSEPVRSGVSPSVRKSTGLGAKRTGSFTIDDLDSEKVQISSADDDEDWMAFLNS